MSSVSCPICGGISRFYASVNGFDAVKCTSCTHVFVLSKECSVTTDLYSEHFYDTYMGGVGYDSAYHAGLKIDFLLKVDLLKSILPAGSRILEVGCGPGYFAKLLENAGFEVTGIELTEGARDYGKKHGVFFPNILSRNVFDPYWDSVESFDAVVSWAVIEHVDDVTSFFDRLVALTKPGGWIFADTGLITPFREWLDTGYTDWLYPPLHLHVFSTKSLALLASQNKDVELCRVFLPSAVAWEGPKHYFKVIRVFCKFMLLRLFRKKSVQQPGKLVATGLILAKKNMS